MARRRRLEGYCCGQFEQQGQAATKFRQAKAAGLDSAEINFDLALVLSRGEEKARAEVRTCWSTPSAATEVSHNLTDSCMIGFERALNRPGPLPTR